MGWITATETDFEVQHVSNDTKVNLANLSMEGKLPFNGKVKYESRLQMMHFASMKQTQYLLA